MHCHQGQHDCSKRRLFKSSAHLVEKNRPTCAKQGSGPRSVEGSRRYQYPLRPADGRAEVLPHRD